MSSPSLSLFALRGLPIVQPGDDLAAQLAACLRAADTAPRGGDILAVTQKIVSKAEGRIRRLGAVTPTARAVELAAQTNKDPRLVELLLQESRGIVRVRRDVLIVEHRLGLVLANAGIDRSNVAGGDDTVLLLPENPDASAAKLRERLSAIFGVPLGVIITDSVGRPWRMGTVGLAIGSAGVPVLQDLRGTPDLCDRPLQVSEVAPADSLAAAAVLVMGEAAEGTPAVLIRGYGTTSGQVAADVLRPRDADLFR